MSTSRAAAPLPGTLMLVLITACGGPNAPAPAPTPVAAAPIAAAPEPVSPPPTTAVSPPAPTLPPVVRAIAAGSSHTCLLLSDTSVRCWGMNDEGQLGIAAPQAATPATIKGLTGVVELALGDNFSCARRSDGTVECWGSDSMGQLGTGSTLGATRATPAAVQGLAGATQIDAGDWHAAALLGDGSLRFWGRNNVGQFGDGSEVDRPAPTPGPRRSRA
ncbi:hypothetical protein [Nannocystis sp.]|uniref:RCC1 domain-containing protein n=1 Tax=Nannocystis sp. TaxID=1962667 RepID=UPI0025FCA2DB|nr:hypothetical protein [Nannocystis sp.]MBK7827007.1 hypothetical protein [Nannocystis sp.]